MAVVVVASAAVVEDELLVLLSNIPGGDGSIAAAHTWASAITLVSYFEYPTLQSTGTESVKNSNFTRGNFHQASSYFSEP